MVRPSPAAPAPSRPLPVRVLRLAGILALGTVLLYLMISPRVAEFFLFLPGRGDPGPAPRVAGIQGEDVSLEARDGTRVHAWWFEAAPDAPAVLFLHGNAGTIGDRVFQAEGMLGHGVSILLLSYRGYGRSEGRPSKAGVIMDAGAALGWLEARVGGRERIVLHGRSLGGAVAGGLLETEGGVAGLVLESSFTDLEAMAAAVYPFIPRFLLRRLKGHLDTPRALARARFPVLVIHGTRDRIVPVEMGRALHEASPPGTRLLEVPGAGHNDLPWVAGPDYFRQVADFVREAVSAGS
jgi:uncharacterized protein